MEEATDNMGEGADGGLEWRSLCKWHGAGRLHWLHRRREAVVLLRVVLPCPSPVLPMVMLTLPAPALRTPLSLIPAGLPLLVAVVVNPSNAGTGAGSTSAVELLILRR
jgi:hypothetical protein